MTPQPEKINIPAFLIFTWFLIDNVNCKKRTQNSNYHCCTVRRQYPCKPFKGPLLQPYAAYFSGRRHCCRGRKFLTMVEERQAAGNAIRTDEWKAVLEELQIGRASFYAMRNKLLGAGLISIKIKSIDFQASFQKTLLIWHAGGGPLSLSSQKKVFDLYQKNYLF